MASRTRLNPTRRKPALGIPQTHDIFVRLPLPSTTLQDSVWSPRSRGSSRVCTLGACVPSQVFYCLVSHHGDRQREGEDGASFRTGPQAAQPTLRIIQAIVRIHISFITFRQRSPSTERCRSRPDDRGIWCVSARRRWVSRGKDKGAGVERDQIKGRLEPSVSRSSDSGWGCWECHLGHGGWLRMDGKHPSDSGRGRNFDRSSCRNPETLLPSRDRPLREPRAGPTRIPKNHQRPRA